MTKTRFNPAVSRLGVPAIPQAASWANHYDGRFGPLMDFSQAVPDFPAHKAVLAELAANAGTIDSTGYGDIEGEPVLRETYATHVTKIYSQEIAARNIHITSGCNQAFVAALIALAGSGDTVVVSNPCYFNHEATAQMLGIKVRYADCLAGNSFQPTLEALAACIDETVRVIALVSPNNPTGAIYPPQTLREIFNLCQQRGIWLILDETYRDFMKPGASTVESSADTTESAPHDLFGQADWQNTFIQLYSFSKSLSIPGHRLGAITAGAETVEMISRVMDNIQICPPRAAQLAVASQLLSMQDWIAANAANLTQRSEIFRTVLSQFPDWKIRSMGAYFAYVQHPYPDRSALEVAKTLAQDYGVRTLPGSFFGQRQEPYLRVAFANANSEIIGQLASRLAEINAGETLTSF